MLFFGDMCQMESVVQNSEIEILDSFYPNTNGDYNFYNAHVMKKDNYFNNSFEIFQIENDFRHKEDPLFVNILKNLRVGKITPKSLNIINKRFKNNYIINENIQYLTVTKSKAEEINEQFMDTLYGEYYYFQANISYKIPGYCIDFKKLNLQFQLTLKIKENMKIMFVQNDKSENGRRWVNGTFGKIKEIAGNGYHDQIAYVKIEISRKGIFKVNREKIQLKDKVKNGKKYEFAEVAELEQFPFIPAYAITIDKSQGLTLDKIGIVLGKHNRPNQIYVALSRAKKLSEILLFERKIRTSDIVFSKSMSSFLNKISPVIKKIYYVDNNKIHVFKIS